MRILWKNKDCGWNWFGVSYGVRRSDILQLFPIWNMSHNCARVLMFGFLKFHFTFTYHRKGSFNQNRFMPFVSKLRNHYQLVY